MNPPDLEVKVVTKIKGLWKLAVLTFLMRHISKRHIVHIHLSDGKRAICAQAVHEVKTPSLSGQA